VKTTVVVATRDPHRQAEGLRAALGLTLRGAAVTAASTEPLTALAKRSSDTLVQVGGHRAGETIALDADAVEIWTGGEAARFPVHRGTRRILHVVRSAEPPPGAVAKGDTVVYLSLVSPDELVAAAFAHELVVTW
jgi:hypothetical protein